MDRQLGFLARRVGVPDPSMASKELHLVQSQRMENGSSSRMVFRDDAVPLPVTGGCVDHAGKPRPPCGFVLEGTKLFSNDKGEVRFFPGQETAALRRSLYGSPSRMERDGGNARDRSWNIDDNDGSDGEDEDDDDEDDGVEDDELDEGDGEVDGLVNADEGNIKNNNNSSGSVHSSSEKMRCEKTNAQEHHSCFGEEGLSRMIMVKDGSDMRGNPGEQQNCEGGDNYDNAITVMGPELYCSQILHEGDGSTPPQKVLGGQNGYGFSSRREVCLPVYPGDSLRTHLSDPVTGILMDDAIILPCGHSFGSGGMQHVHRMKACFKCSMAISEDSIRPNLALRAAVQAFLREEESHSSRISKRRRDRFEQDKYNYDDQLTMDSRTKGVQFPFNVSDRVIIKGNKRTAERFVGKMAVVTTQCLNGWYVVKTLDSAESVKLQYRSLAKVADESSTNSLGNKSISSNWP